MYSFVAISYLMPLLTNIFLILGIYLAFRKRFINLLWLLSRFRQSMHSFLQRLQSIPYMFAEGPPKSSIFPLKCGSVVIYLISLKIDSSEREIILFPIVNCSEQKLQLPMHPLCVTTLNSNPLVLSSTDFLVKGSS